MRGNFRSILVACLGAGVCASVAIAITYGQPDGNRHPNVGAVVFQPTGSSQKALLCSGTLIAPTVFLTAAHCAAYLEAAGISEVWVTFDTAFTQSSTLISGTMHKNPDYNRHRSDPKDIAVVTLASSPPAITPATLPTAGLFDQMATSHALKGQQFVAVGYGALQPQIGGGPPQWEYPDIRRFATSTFGALNNAWLRLSQNPATGDGGTCFGDSGGPNFFGGSGMIAALTVTGDAMCRAANVVYRLDTPSARDFLAQYVTLP